MSRLEELEKEQLENKRIKERFFTVSAGLQTKLNVAMDRYLAGKKEAISDIKKARKELRDLEKLFNAYQFYLYDWTFETRTLVKMGLDY